MVKLIRSWASLGAVALTLTACAANDAQERFPTSKDYPATVMHRAAFAAGVPEHWRLSSLRTPDRPQARWRIVIVTGTPSWSEYWAPTIAKVPDMWEMIVVDRPGFSESEPREPVTDIARQAEAIAPALEGPPGQRVVLVGQSFGSPIAILMAQAHPERVRAVVLVSSYFGDRGPTARRLLSVGRAMQPILPRDLRNSVAEVSAQERQLPRVWEALRSLDIPLVFLHGDADTFVPIESVRRIASTYNHTLIAVPGGDHFLNACCVDSTLAAIEQAIAEAEGRESAQPPAALP